MEEVGTKLSILGPRRPGSALTLETAARTRASGLAKGYSAQSSPLSAVRMACRLKPMVALYPATSDAEKISFNQINRKTGHRIRYLRVDVETGEEWPTRTSSRAIRSTRTREPAATKIATVTRRRLNKGHGGAARAAPALCREIFGRARPARGRTLLVTV